MTQRKPKKGRHGGARAGAGRPTVFAASNVKAPFPMVFTTAGRRALDRIARRTKLSRNAILATLAIAHADGVTFAEGDRFPSKTDTVLAVRVPPEAALKLKAARRRTKRSYSDIGEMLLRCAARTAFPEALGGA